MADTYTLGLDLGQMTDYTALTALQTVRPPGAQEDTYHLRHAERFDLGTPYTGVAEKVRRVQETEPLKSSTLRVVVDVTGVGLPVFEMLKAAEVRGLVGVSIHGGDAVSREGSIYRVPKRDLVSTVQVLLQTERLKIAEGLTHGPLLRHEMQSFRAKINLSTGHDSYEAWREGDHDDLVLSLAMACWFAENVRPARPRLHSLAG